MIRVCRREIDGDGVVCYETVLRDCAENETVLRIWFARRNHRPNISKVVKCAKVKSKSRINPATYTLIANLVVRTSPLSFSWRPTSKNVEFGKFMISMS